MEVKEDKPQVRRPPDIVLPIGQPLPKPLAIEWWLRRIGNQGKGR